MFLNILQRVVEMVALSSYIGMERLAPLFDRTVNDALVQEFQFLQNTLSHLLDGLNCPCVDLLLKQAPHLLIFTGLRSGLFGGQSNGGMKSGILRLNSSTASRAQ